MRSQNNCRILALFWMCVIFSFAQEKEESSQVSEAFSYRMVPYRTLFHLNLMRNDTGDKCD